MRTEQDLLSQNVRPTVVVLYSRMLTQNSTPLCRNPEGMDLEPLPIIRIRQDTSTTGGFTSMA